MAKTYTSTITIDCRKEHTCAGCGAVFSYPFRRKITGQARTAEKAALKAQQNVTIALAQQVDLQPCPTCGLYQADMIAQQRRKRHLIIVWLGLLALVLLLIIRAARGMQANTATYVMAAACLVVLAAHALVEWANLNKDPAANANLAAKRSAEGVMLATPGRVGAPSPELVHPPKTALHKVALPLLLIATGLIYSPEILRGSNHWPVNDEAYPPVVGAGDTTRLYMNQKISSIKSYWRGEPEAVLHIPGKDAKDDVPLTATTNENTWGNNISFKSSERDSSSTPWIEVTMPSTDLTGQKVDCMLEMNVQYPHYERAGVFNVEERSLKRTVSLIMAPPGAGHKYNTWWWEFTPLGISLALLGGVLLVRGATALRRRALPTRVFK